MKRIFVILSVFLCHPSFTVLAGQSQTLTDTIDLVISNVTIVDVVNEQVIESGSIHVNKGRIVSLSKTSNTVARRVIDGKELVALPGFINTHTHLWQHISKSGAPNDKLQDWVRIYQPIHYLTEEEVYKVVRAACGEAMLSGVTSVSDYASLGFNDYGLNSSCLAMKDAGMGGVVIWNNPSIFLPDSLKVLEITRLRNQYRGQFEIWMGHGPLSFHSISQVYSAIPIAKKLGMHISEHLMENVQEQRDFYTMVKMYIDSYGSRLSDADKAMLQSIVDMPFPSLTDSYYLMEQKARALLEDSVLGRSLSDSERLKLRSISGVRTVSPLPLLQSWDILTNYLAIHAVWPQQEDLRIMKDYIVSVSHNPESNMYLSSGIAPTYQYKKEGIVVSIGTDGAASNDGIDFFSAMKNMWNLNKINLMDASIKDVNEWDILRAATINGAKALLIADNTGSLDIGKEADIILLKKETLGLSPFKAKTLPALLIYSANPSCIEYVLSDGKPVVQSGKLTNTSEQLLAHQLSEIAAAGEQRNLQGKQWSETFLLDSGIVNRYWYKYRSVRQMDEFALKIKNKGTQKLRLYFVSSGQRFSGGSPMVVDQNVAKRFPENAPKTGAFLKEIILSPRQTIDVAKEKNTFKYTFFVNGKKENIAGSSGQFLIVGFNQKE